jgi:hypothetical protein
MEERRLVPVEPEDVRRIVVERATGRLVLAKEGSDWRLLEPVTDLADSGSAESLARSIATMSVGPRAGGDESLEGHALRSPGAIVVQIETADGGPRRVEIGPDEAGEDRDARRADGSLWGRVPDAAAGELDRAADEFRDRRLVVLPTAAIRELRIESGGSRLRAWREKDDGPWSLQEGSGSARPADAGKVEGLLDRFRWARAETFLSGSVAGKTEHTVILRGAEGEMGRLEIGVPFAATGAPGTSSTGTRVPVRSSWRPGIVLTVAAESLAPLPTGVADLMPDPAGEKGEKGEKKEEHEP